MALSVLKFNQCTDCCNELSRIATKKANPSTPTEKFHIGIAEELNIFCLLCESFSLHTFEKIQPEDGIEHEATIHRPRRLNPFPPVPQSEKQMRREFPSVANSIRTALGHVTAETPMAHFNRAYLGSRDDRNGNIADNNNICHLTLEAFPRIDNYTLDDTKKKRPSISQLYGEIPYNGVSGGKKRPSISQLYGEIPYNGVSGGKKRPFISQLYGEIPYNGVSGGKKRPFISQLYGEIPYNGVSGGKKRPSISQLYGEIPYNGDILSDRAIQRAPDGTSIADATGGAGSNTHGVKLGWIVGVLIPCLLNIWGVMLFLRMAWVVGEAGIGHSLVIIGISYVVCIITTLSLSAITTNGEVKGGGIYFIISRSLGPEFGASIGIILAFANAVAASMNTIGFCNSLNDLLASYHTKIIDGGVNDIRLVGVIAILIMVIICSFGMDWESKAQNVLLVLIVIAIIDFLIGAILGPRDNTSIAQGFVGFNMTVFKQNWYPDYHYSEGQEHDFFSVFAIFFPSVTGIQAGANISGDLKVRIEPGTSGVEG
ncbi:hypothetical protein M8J77_023765 [Diaphorina citri]|nr:hypothetical protein M8J77_023765 [Diaphorina citri]